MRHDARIYIAGHTGLVGSALKCCLQKQGYFNLITASSAALDLRNQEAVNAFFKAEQPEYVFMAAAKVGGILANATYRGQFIYDNLMIATNIIHAAWQQHVTKLLFLGSSCIYPRLAEQPIQESALLSGKLEPSNEPYAIAKIAGIKLCEAYRDQYGCNFITVMPTNLYGDNDNFDLETAHVLPALIRKFHEAKLSNSKTVTLWGTGLPQREFLHVADLAKACVLLMQHYNGKDPINAGTGQDISIGDLALLIKDIVGYAGSLSFDTGKPDGTPRKVLDVSQLQAMGFTPDIDLKTGIQQVYQFYCKQTGLVTHAVY
jgi:GDP-L-fucose synthase